MPNLARWCGVLCAATSVFIVAPQSAQAVVFDECGHQLDLEQRDPTAAFVLPRCTLIPPPFRVLDYRFTDSPNVLSSADSVVRSDTTGSIPAARISKLESTGKFGLLLHAPDTATSAGTAGLKVISPSDRDDPSGFFEQLRTTPIGTGEQAAN